MTGNKNYFEMLYAIHELTTDRLQCVETSHVHLFEATLKELEEFKTFIPKFFSEEPGSGNKIKELYSNINKIKNVDIHRCVMIEKSSKMYGEYMQGMYTYITSIIQQLWEKTPTEESIIKISSNLINVKSKDSMFIDSLFGGVNNPFILTHASEAIENIEFLIDFVPELNTVCEILKKLIALFTKLNIECTEESEICKLTWSNVFLFCESIRTYAYSVMVEVISTYYKLTEAYDYGKVPDKKISAYL